MALRRITLVALVILTIAAATAIWALWVVTGAAGVRQDAGAIAATYRDPALQGAERERQREARGRLDGDTAVGKQILFGDLHVHSTFSFDAYTISLPLYRGEGSHPPGDACDFARFCSGLDFWSINDHAEALTARQWTQTKELVRQCNAVAGDPDNPDMVTFLGWEWTQSGTVAESHYGHQNVVLRDTGDDEVPTRPIAAIEIPAPQGLNLYIARFRLLLVAGIWGGDPRQFLQRIVGWWHGGDDLLPDAGERQRYYDFIRYLQDQSELQPCPSGIPVRELPANCREAATTPADLLARLDEWGFPYLTIPHGNAWGFYTPPLKTWDRSLANIAEPERQVPLIEIFSGHGNSEEYRNWRSVGVDARGGAFCPGPTRDFLPTCWRAGEIIRERCLAAGEPELECERRAGETRERFIETKSSGHWLVSGVEVEDWLDAGQCRDCYLPTYDHRPGGSVQYGLAIRNFDDSTAQPKRFRWGFVGSSDSHSARAGSGYKEIQRLRMTDAAVGKLADTAPPSLRAKLPAPVAVPRNDGRYGPYHERQSSFYYTGGLVAVHARGRDRHAIWEALQRREVYATSGDRILLWFDLVDDGTGSPAPMGSTVRRDTVPEFTVSAVGAFEQKPGCPPDSLRALSPERLQRLCGGECYHPGDERKRIERIEVVRILPQVRAGEAVGDLIEDPWRVLPCPSTGEGCTVRFSDPEFAELRRDAVYYVRALEEATPTVNGDNLRCERDATGQCVAVRPCHGDASEQDDCLSDARERAWSSPIFVDFDRGSQGPRIDGTSTD